MLLDLLETSGQEFSSLARVLVYSVMVHPRNERARKRMLAAARAHEHLTPRIEAKALIEARTAARKGLAGAILLRLIQIDEAGHKPSLNAASFLLSVTWPDDWLTDPEFSRLRGLETGRQRERHLKAWNMYRPVAHLWGAFLLPLMQHLDAPTFLDDGADFVKFLHTADWLAVRGSQIYLDNPGRRRREPAMECSKTWRFILPSRYRVDPAWTPEVPPLTEKELRALTSVKIARRTTA